MPDKTITELDALTVSASSDSLVVYDTSASGTLKLTVANLVNKVPTWLGFSQTAQTLSGAGAVDVTSAITWVVTTGTDDLTLADGTEGQDKFVIMKTDGGNGTLTPASSPANYSTIQFNDVGDSAQLLFTNAAWHIVGYHGVTIA